MEITHNVIPLSYENFFAYENQAEKALHFSNLHMNVLVRTNIWVKLEKIPVILYSLCYLG